MIRSSPTNTVYYVVLGLRHGKIYRKDFAMVKLNPLLIFIDARCRCLHTKFIRQSSDTSPVYHLHHVVVIEQQATGPSWCRSTNAIAEKNQGRISRTSEAVVSVAVLWNEREETGCEGRY